MNTVENNRKIHLIYFKFLGQRVKFILIITLFNLNKNLQDYHPKVARYSWTV